MVDVLIVGSGGREHALGWAIRKSPQAGRLFFAPGNAGTAGLDNAENIAVGAEDVAGLVAWAKEHKPTLTVIGPEVPLAAGLADQLRGLGLLVVGPGAEGAQIEASKVWAKGFMAEFNIPTAASERFSELPVALDYIKANSGPYVLKADGLAAGKGVVVTDDRAEAAAFAKGVMHDRIFGEAGSQLLIEEFMQGQEVSMLAFFDTHTGTVLPLEPACDYKRALDNDGGPNTGGMGAYSPTRLVTPEISTQIMNRILFPVMHGMLTRGIDYRGVLYAGLMMTADGPKVVEFNCRMGDPETQSLLPRLQSDLLEILLLLADGSLHLAPPLEWDSRASVGVVLASGGYPGSYLRGLPITITPQPDIFIFHAGTSLANNENGTIHPSSFILHPSDTPTHPSSLTPHPLTSGGRVINVIAMDETIALARARVYNAISNGVVNFERMQYRSDIAARES